MNRPAMSEPGLHIQCLRLRGPLDLDEVTKIESLLDEYLAAGFVHVLLNLGRCTRVGMDGLPILAARAKRLKEYGGGLKLSEVPAHIRHVFSLAGYRSTFEFLDSDDEAMESFAGRHKKNT